VAGSGALARCRVLPTRNSGWGSSPTGDHHRDRDTFRFDVVRLNRLRPSRPQPL